MSSIDDRLSANKRGLGLLTFAYFIIELLINYQIYNQLSAGSTFITIDVMEFWGKVITGLGLALLLTRLFFIKTTQMNHDPYYRYARRSTLKDFFLLCIITIPLSFFLQNALINHIVGKADEDQRNQAMLVAAAHNSVTPFYSFSNTKYSDGGSGEKDLSLDLDFIEKIIYPFVDEKEYFVPDINEVRNIEDIYVEYYGLFKNASEKCIPIGRETLGLNKGLDRVFFSYTALHSKSNNDELYKKVISDYYSCLFADDKYRFTHTASIPYKQQFLEDMFWKSYMPGVERWTAAKRRGKARADEAWRSQLNDLFGFKTTLKPSNDFGNYDAFMRHPDVRRYYNENAGPDAKGLYPYDDSYKENYKAFLISKLPYAVIPTYVDVEHPTVGSIYNIRYNRMEQITPEEIKDAGEAAYKAAVMPMVALWLSAFFLIFNLVTVGYSFASRAMHVKKAVLIFAVVLLWLTVYPAISSLHDYENHAVLNDQEKRIKLLYFHENLLVSFYEWFND